MATIRIQTEDFDAGEAMTRLRQGNPAVGAVACFVGLVRDVNTGERVSEMTLEHYPGMTEKALEAIAAQAQSRWRLIDVTIVHRVGTLKPCDPIVLVAVASAHRGDAFSACEFIMDYLKTRAPLWKKEATGEGQRWAESRDSDTAAARRWQG